MFDCPNEREPSKWAQHTNLIAEDPRKNREIFSKIVKKRPGSA